MMIFAPQPVIAPSVDWTLVDRHMVNLPTLLRQQADEMALGFTEAAFQSVMAEFPNVVDWAFGAIHAEREYTQARAMLASPRLTNEMHRAAIERDLARAHRAHVSAMGALYRFRAGEALEVLIRRERGESM